MTILDVRSPSEYLHAHIPGAINMPLFSDEERRLVGICYKQTGKQEAIELGLQFSGPKLSSFVQHAKKLKAPILIYCARGGLRSHSMEWLLKTAGLLASAIPGGYKKFRYLAQQSLLQKRKLQILGGYTGSGKTKILQLLKQRGKQVLDLESLAHHHGSVFGSLEHIPQPSNEHFENQIAAELLSFDPEKEIWIEDESRLIGTCMIPNPLYVAMKSSPLIKIERSKADRITYLMQHYSKAPKESLIGSIKKLQKRLGQVRTELAISLVESNDFENCINLLLEYYDKAYDFALIKRSSKIISLPFEEQESLCKIVIT